MNEEELKPGIIEQVKSLAHLGKAVVNDAIEGKSMFASDELFQERIQTCLKCEHFDPSSGGKCRKCGCILGLKARMFSGKCPIDKWTST